MKRVVIAPHADDEVLGCSSVIDGETFVYYCGIDKFHVISKEERIKEIEKVSEYFGFEFIIEGHSTVNYYETNKKQFIDSIQSLINYKRPEEIYIPWPGYNQDHCTIYHAAMVALRPHDSNFFVPKVLCFEGVDTISWMEPDYKVNYFRPLNFGKKIEGYKLHASQVREHRSFKLLESLARLRGFQSNNEFAEAFMIERWT